MNKTILAIALALGFSAAAGGVGYAVTNNYNQAKIKDLNTQVEQKETANAGQRQEISGLNKHVNSLTTENIELIKEKQRIIDESNAAISEKNTIIDELTLSGQDKSDTIKSLQNDVESLQKKVSAYQEDIKAIVLSGVRIQVDSEFSSLSYLMFIDDYGVVFVGNGGLYSLKMNGANIEKVYETTFNYVYFTKLNNGDYFLRSNEKNSGLILFNHVLKTFSKIVDESYYFDRLVQMSDGNYLVSGWSSAVNTLVYYNTKIQRATILTHDKGQGFSCEKVFSNGDFVYCVISSSGPKTYFYYSLSSNESVALKGNYFSLFASFKDNSFIYKSSSSSVVEMCYFDVNDLSCTPLTLLDYMSSGDVYSNWQLFSRDNFNSSNVGFELLDNRYMFFSWHSSNCYLVAFDIQTKTFIDFGQIESMYNARESCLINNIFYIKLTHNSYSNVHKWLKIDLENHTFVASNDVSCGICLHDLSYVELEENKLLLSDSDMTYIFDSTNLTFTDVSSDDPPGYYKNLVKNDNSSLIYCYNKTNEILVKIFKYTDNSIVTYEVLSSKDNQNFVVYQDSQNYNYGLLNQNGEFTLLQSFSSKIDNFKCLSNGNVLLCGSDTSSIGLSLFNFASSSLISLNSTIYGTFNSLEIDDNVLLYSNQKAYLLHDNTLSEFSVNTSFSWFCKVSNTLCLLYGQNSLVLWDMSTNTCTTLSELYLPSMPSWGIGTPFVKLSNGNIFVKAYEELSNGYKLKFGVFDCSDNSFTLCSGGHVFYELPNGNLLFPSGVYDSSKKEFSLLCDVNDTLSSSFTFSDLIMEDLSDRYKLITSTSNNIRLYIYDATMGDVLTICPNKNVSRNIKLTDTVYRFYFDNLSACIDFDIEDGSFYFVFNV